jgi:hypothetical protein
MRGKCLFNHEDHDDHEGVLVFVSFVFFVVDTFHSSPTTSQVLSGLKRSILLNSSRVFAPKSF